MSLLNYFQKVRENSTASNISLSTLKFTTRATEEVFNELKNVEEKGKKINKYCVCTPQKRT